MDETTKKAGKFRKVPDLCSQTVLELVPGHELRNSDTHFKDFPSMARCRLLLSARDRGWGKWSLIYQIFFSGESLSQKCNWTLQSLSRFVHGPRFMLFLGPCSLDTDTCLVLVWWWCFMSDNLCKDSLSRDQLLPALQNVLKLEREWHVVCKLVGQIVSHLVNPIKEGPSQNLDGRLSGSKTRILTWS